MPTRVLRGLGYGLWSTRQSPKATPPLVELPLGSIRRSRCDILPMDRRVGEFPCKARRTQAAEISSSSGRPGVDLH
jgi:hypothetical protein